MKKLKLLKLSLLLSLSLNIFSQENSERYANFNYMQPSPTVASMNKFVDIPISNYTGIPDIHIPVYTISCGDISIPINLKYHSNGIKVGDEASWVGLGWTLEYGGCISRVVSNLPDELDNYGYLDYVKNNIPEGLNNFNNKIDFDNPFYYENNTYKFKDQYSSKKSIMKNIEQGAGDLEPDRFCFSFLGYSGSFYINPYNNTVKCLPENDLKIMYFRNSNKFVIKDEKGNEYHFTTKETTSTETINYPSVTSSSTSAVTAWQLDKIVPVNSTENIYFNYKSVFEYSDSHFSSVDYIPNGYFSDKHDKQYRRQISSINTKKIETISYKNTFVSFKTSERNDMKESSQKLDSIIIKYDNKTVKKVKLDNDYFNSGSSDYKERRLKLTDVIINPDSDNPLKYSFNYNNVSLPGKHSRSVDYWGFYNGKSNSDFTPSMFIDDRYIDGANRHPDFSNTKAGVLNEIVYPTGGKAVFTWEPNVFTSDSWIKFLPCKNISPKVFYGEVSNPSNGQNQLGLPVNITHQQFIDISYTSSLSGNFTNEYLKDNIYVIVKSQDYSITAKLSELDSKSKYIMKEGDYEILVSSLFFDQLNGSFNIVVNYGELDSSKPLEYEGGGLRISNMNFYGKDFDLKLSKAYRYTENNTTTGKLIGGFPKYTYIRKLVDKINSVTPGVISAEGKEYIVLSSSPNIEFGSMSGGYVGYSKVTHEVLNNGFSDSGSLPIVSNENSGITEYYYTSPKNYQGHAYCNSYPYSPFISNAWLQGRIDSTLIYDTENTLIEKTINKYNVDYTGSLTSGIRLGYFVEKPTGLHINGEEQVGETDYFRHSFYEIYTGYINRTSTEKYSYFNGICTMVRDSILYHNSYINIPKQTTNEYSKKKVINRYYYPVDNDSKISMNSTERSFMDLNNIKIPLLKESLVIESGNSILTNSSESIFNKTSMNKFYVSSVIKKLSDSDNQKYKTVVNIINSDLKVVNYTKLFNDKVLEPGSTILWAYNNEFPAAIITGASYNDVISELNKNYSITDFNNLMNSDIIKSAIDKLRSSDKLKKAQITSYTYHLLHGVKTITDANGKTTTYDYDDFGRLIQVKDHKGNIIKQVEYNYAQ